MRLFQILPVALPIVALAAVVLTTAPTAAPLPTAASTVSGVRLNSFESRILALLNSARAAAGASRVTIVPGLTDLGRSWSYQQAKRDAISHNPHLQTDLNSHGSQWHYAAENVGTTASSSPDLLFKAFMQSPGHRRNNLDPRARYVGIGVVEHLTPLGDLQAYVTMDFADVYSSSYGADRVAAAGMARDSWTPDATHRFPAIQNGDQRLDTATYSGPAAGLVSFTHTLLGIGAVVAFQDTGGTGSSRVSYHDALALRPGRTIVVTIAAQTRTGTPVMATLSLRNAAAGYASRPVRVRLTGVSQRVTLTVPANFTQPVTEIAVVVSSADLDALSILRPQRYARILLLGVSSA